MNPHHVQMQFMRNVRVLSDRVAKLRCEVIDSVVREAWLRNQVAALEDIERRLRAQLATTRRYLLLALLLNTATLACAVLQVLA